MLNLLVSPIASILKDTVKGFVETKKAKAELAVTEIKAKTKLKEDQIAGKVAWESSAVNQMENSIKDEIALIVLLLPAVLVFIPFMTPHIKAGFEALHSLPTYYQHLLYIAISASFGIKGASGAMKLLKK
jgi:hypothetical protein|tara:strand:+ start:2109 stop:2498 length:390 start_codon:yes stop_codon:yes gene_type:complete